MGHESQSCATNKNIDVDVYVFVVVVVVDGGGSNSVYCNGGGGGLLQYNAKSRASLQRKSRHMRAWTSDFITQASTLEDHVALESHPAILCLDRTVIREFLCLQKT